VNEFWGSNNSIKKASFSPYLINEMLKKPKETGRTMPFGLSYPALYDEEIEVNLPDYWDAKESSDEIKCAGFALTYKYICTGKKLLLQYHYQNLKDHVTAEEAKEFFAGMNKADENLGYSLTQSTEDETVSGTPAGTLTGNYSSLYFVLGLCVFITFVVRRRKRENRW